MPTYVFICDAEEKGCGKLFEIHAPMCEVEGLNPSCPHCDQTKPTRRDWKSQTINVFDSAPRTVGTLTERNSQHISADEQNHINRKNTKYLRDKKKAPLPKGMTRATVDTRRSPDKDPRKKK